MRELQLKFISNTVTARWFQILNVIEREQTFTIVNLSERLEVSQRTLITDIGYLKTHFEKSARFTYNSNRYTFEETDRLFYQEQKQELLVDEVLFEIIGNIFYGEVDTLTALADYYSYSESTLRRFLVLAQKALIDYDLEVSFTPVTIIGKEENIRKFFFDFYYEGAQTPHTLHPPKDLHELLIEELSEHLGEYELGTGCTVTAFYYLLYITMERNRQGLTVTLPEQLKTIDVQERDFQLLFSLQGAIEQRYGVCLSKEEFCWIHYQIISRRTLNRKDLEETFFERFNQWPELEKITTTFLRATGVDQREQDQLAPFLHTFFLTRKYNDQISPVLNKVMAEEKVSVITNYSSELKRAIHFLDEHQGLLGLSEAYFEDVAVSLTLYSYILFHYYAPKRTILFLLEGDYLITQYIRAQAQQLLGYRHSIRYLKIKELNEAQLKHEEVDLLVTNYSPYVSDYSLTKDYVLMKQVPDRQDWARVLDKLNSLVNKPV
ncbi:helix-turn-helix domain-containing protein [Enterococcus sp. OL5]|uniref:helix-turn-helix domain-containing protein n=1 Tax=Enterococcus sp. OL5 TaxID=2590214 RepID=UPI0011287B77|nr:helix-turn-helix domain-containing protein [Enterococcus sp. OL5]TPR55093.1 M protein trans-acting positive regulator [Enterococcus sp. OL5]